jgi:polysaccharide biosynthesis protein PslJ
MLAVLGSLALAVAVVEYGVFAGLGLLLGLIGAVAIVSDVRAGLWAAVAVATLLPFGVIPMRVGLTLTLLEAALILTIGIWLLQLMLLRDRIFPATLQSSLVFLLLMVTLFAFLLGIGRGYTSQTFHDYFKFVLAVAIVCVVWTSVHSLADARRLTTVLLLGGGASALLGLALYAAGPGISERVLARLIPIGYPDHRIVRFIEDDPARPMRLVSTSVDPNSIGGMLALVFVLAAAQGIARNRLIPLWLCVPVAALSAPALLLTYSRGAWLGAAAGLGVVAVLRYRWLIPAGLAALAPVMFFGFGAGFVERLWLGFTLQDPATRLRISEYRNALAIIREYPAFGVGFGDAPSIELQAGVSSIYLAIAQRTGFVGLAAFLLAIGAVLYVGLKFWRGRRAHAEGDLMLALLAALVAALVIGVFDHYFFNISFPHMAALLWGLAGLVLALAVPVPRLRYNRRH